MRLWQQHHVHLCRRRQVHGHDRRQNNVTMSLSMLANCCAQHLRCLHTCYFCHLLHWYDTPTAKHLYCSIPQFHSSTTTIICWSLVTYIYCRNNWTDECPLAATQRESIVCRKPGASSEHESTAKRSETTNIRTKSVQHQQHQQNMHRSKSRLTQLIDEMFQTSRPAMCAQHISQSRVWACIQFESNIFLSRDLKQAHISILTCMRVSTVPSRPSSPDLLLENYCSNKSISNQSRNSYLTSTLHCQLVAFTIVRWRIAAQFSNRTAGMLVGRLSGSKLFQSL